MTFYTLHVTKHGAEATADLETLDELAERVGLEQLLHELNPLEPAGYTVSFVVTRTDVEGACTPGVRQVADGHFYVRPASCVVAPTETGNRPS